MPVDLSQRPFALDTSRVNWRHPLALGLEHYWLFNSGQARDLVGNVAPQAYGAGMALTTSPYGAGASSAGTAGVGPFSGRAGLTNTWSLALLYNITADVQLQGLYGHGGTDGTRQVLHVSDSYSETINFNLYSDDWASYYGKILGVWRVVVLTYDASNNGRVYVNGNMTADSPHAFGGALNTDASIYLASEKFHTFNGSMVMTALWKNRVLTPGEAAMLYRDPFAVLHGPVPALYFPPAGGGGGGGLAIPVAMAQYRQRWA